MESELVVADDPRFGGSLDDRLDLKPTEARKNPMWSSSSRLGPWHREMIQWVNQFHGLSLEVPESVDLAIDSKEL